MAQLHSAGLYIKRYEYCSASILSQGSSMHSTAGSKHCYGNTYICDRALISLTTIEYGKKLNCDYRYFEYVPRATINHFYYGWNLTLDSRLRLAEST
jgi:hypothetical protein